MSAVARGTFCVLCFLLLHINAGFASEFCFSGSSDVLQVSEWSITPIDANTNSLRTVYKNNLGKPIRMIDGSAGFVDALGMEIARHAIERDISVSADGVFEEVGRWGLHTFERLLTLRSEEVVAFACVRTVLFEDGTKQEF